MSKRISKRIFHSLREQSLEENKITFFLSFLLACLLCLKKKAAFPDCTLSYSHSHSFFSTDGNHAIMRSHFHHCHFNTRRRRRRLFAHLVCGSYFCCCFVFLSFFSICDNLFWSLTLAAAAFILAFFRCRLFCSPISKRRFCLFREAKRK